MRLESLQIAGFKSFAEPVLLEFPQTITVVVGPNGSGKSNVVDAVKWVLGEQSARHLRCNRMDELIFSGSEARRRLGMAEVIANFRDGSEEISIARRIDRSGRSDYRINGRRCRLRDVHDLFFDTGLGRSSYAIIGQGEVERIVEARGDEIRGYVEEVAGVERHRIRVSAIQKNLAEAREDLRRLDDVIRVREEYLEPLKDQAKRARLHRLLGKREEAIRVRLVQAELRKATAEVQKLEERRAGVANRIKTAGQSQKRHKMKLDGHDKELEEITARRKLLERGLSNLRGQRDNCRAELAVLNERRRSLQDSRAQAENAAAEVKSVQREMETGRASEKSVEVLESELESLEGEMEGLRRERETVAGRVDRLDGILGRTEKIASDLRVRSRTLESDMQATDRQLQRAFVQASRARERQDELDAEDGESDEDSSQLQVLERELREIESERASVRAQIDSHEDELNRYSERAEILRDRLVRWETRAETLREMIQNAAAEDPGGEGTNRVLAHQIRVPEGLEGAVEAGLDRWLEAHLQDPGNKSSGADVVLFPSVIDESLRRWWLVRWRRERGRWEDWCVNRGFGESVLGWLDELLKRREQNSAVQAAASYLLQEFLVVEDRATLRALARKLWDDDGPAAPDALPLPRLLTPDGDRADLGGGIALAPEEDGEQDAVQRWAEIRRLTAAAEETKEELAQAEAMAEDAEEQCAGWRDRLDELDEAGRDRRGRIDLHHAEKQRRERRRKRRCEEQQELHESTRQVADLEKEKAELERLMMRSERAAAELAGHRRRYDEKVKPERERLADVNAQLNDIERERISLRERIESERRRRSDLKKERQRLEGQLRHWQKSLNAYEEDLACTAEQQDALREREGALDGAISRTEDRLRRCGGREDTLTEAAEQLRDELRRLREERERLERDANRVEVRLARAQTRYEQVEREVREAGVEPEKVDLSPGSPVERKLGEMRRSLSKMEARRRELEPVNPLSIGEYRRESRRWRHMRKHRDDMAGALEALREVLHGTRDELDVRFKESLRATSDAFHRSFSDLFEGGHAELRLKGDSVWDGQVEVRVQPPGKKLTRLSLLSGGERALAGIAFLFALLNMRPAPICVFDEIDAALDDANTGKFARYVRRWRDEAQYLLITHQKRTMEAADAMHGVTMSEPGVSELVSVRLQGRDEADVSNVAAEGNGEGTA